MHGQLMFLGADGAGLYGVDGLGSSRKVPDGDSAPIPLGLGSEDHIAMTDRLCDTSDAALVVAIGRLHQDALAEAYRRHAGAVYSLARRVLQLPSLAEEIVQEVFLRLWHSPEKFDAERGSLRSFLLAQTHGRAVDVLRSDIARRRREEAEIMNRGHLGYDLEHEVLDITTGSQLDDAIGGLPEVEREAIRLAYFGGLTYRQVAAALGTPEGTVKSRIRAGLKRLRPVLVNSGAGP